MLHLLRGQFEYARDHLNQSGKAEEGSSIDDKKRSRMSGA